MVLSAWRYPPPLKTHVYTQLKHVTHLTDIDTVYKLDAQPEPITPKLQVGPALI